MSTTSSHHKPNIAESCFEMLCAICKNIPVGFFWDGSRMEGIKIGRDGKRHYEYPASVAEIKQTSRPDCELCQLLKSMLQCSRTAIGMEDDLWSTVSNEESGESLPATETTIRVTADGENVLNLVGMENGLAWRGGIRFDTRGSSKCCFQL
jgi:hypothetical protein